MIRHVYCFKLKDKSAAGEIAAKLLTLKEHVPYMASIEVGLDFKGAKNSWDLVELCSFHTREDFAAFGKNEYHAGIREYMADKYISSCKVDYETQGE